MKWSNELVAKASCPPLFACCRVHIAASSKCLALSCYMLLSRKRGTIKMYLCTLLPFVPHADITVSLCLASKASACLPFCCFSLSLYAKRCEESNLYHSSECPVFWLQLKAFLSCSRNLRREGKGRERKPKHTTWRSLYNLLAIPIAHLSAW